jgi:hypothetical protein
MKRLFSVARTLSSANPFTFFTEEKAKKPFHTLVVYNTPAYAHTDNAPMEDPNIIKKFKAHIDAQFAQVHLAWQKNPASIEAEGVLVKILGSEFYFNGIAKWTGAPDDGSTGMITGLRIRTLLTRYLLFREA